MVSKRSILAPLVVALFALVTGGWLLQRGMGSERNIFVQARLFEEVIQHISDRYVDRQEPSRLYRMAIDGLLQELGDPHTTFMSPQDYDRLRSQTQGEYGGLGIEIDIREGWVTVVSPLPGTPAERAGLRAGDRIIEVEGETTRGWTTDDAVNRLRGPRGRAVDIRVARPGAAEPIPFRIVREQIEIRAIRTAYVEDGVGYIELRMFSETATDELNRAVRGLRDQGMRSLILDLRRNPGGLLDQGILTSDLFLDRGATVAQTRSRVRSQNQEFRAERREQYAGMPIIVLVGPGSASASEILAGALQDHDRALVIGHPTFGKGSVQTLYPLSGGNFLKLTTARWYTPLGRSIHRAYTPEEERRMAAEGDMPDLPDASERPEYQTPSGRVVFGGGGIYPDIVVEFDQLTDDERAFRRATLERHGSKYLDALAGFAVDHVVRNPDIQPGFPVTASMVAGFHRHLAEQGIEVDRQVYDGAGDLVRERLAFQISYAKWGEPEAKKRLNTTDPEVRLARRLLLEAPDVAGLFTLAKEHNGATQVKHTNAGN